MSYQEVIILTPWDSQGNQITDSDGICHTIRGCHGGGYQQGYILQRKNDLSESDRLSEPRSASRELQRTGCVQRYVGD